MIFRLFLMLLLKRLFSKYVLQLAYTFNHYCVILSLIFHYDFGILLDGSNAPDANSHESCDFTTDELFYIPTIG